MQFCLPVEAVAGRSLTRQPTTKQEQMTFRRGHAERVTLPPPTTAETFLGPTIL